MIIDRLIRLSRSSFNSQFFKILKYSITSDIRNNRTFKVLDWKFLRMIALMLRVYLFNYFDRYNLLANDIIQHIFFDAI